MSQKSKAKPRTCADLWPIVQATLTRPESIAATLRNKGHLRVKKARDVLFGSVKTAHLLRYQAFLRELESYPNGSLLCYLCAVSIGQGPAHLSLAEREILSHKFLSVARESAVVNLSSLSRDSGISRDSNASWSEPIAESHELAGVNNRSAGDDAVRSVIRHATSPVRSGMPPPVMPGASYFSIARRDKIASLGHMMQDAIMSSNTWAREEHDNKGGAIITKCVHISATVGKEDAVITMIVGYETAWKLLDALEYGEVDGLRRQDLES